MVDMGGSLPYEEQKGCPPGFHKRNSYTSKLGHRVPPRCVKAQTVYKETRRNYSRRILQRQQHRFLCLNNAAIDKEKELLSHQNVSAPDKLFGNPKHNKF
jgi:hypothetical protein